MSFNNKIHHIEQMTRVFLLSDYICFYEFGMSEVKHIVQLVSFLGSISDI